MLLLLLVMVMLLTLVLFLLSFPPLSLLSVFFIGSTDIVGIIITILSSVVLMIMILITSKTRSVAILTKRQHKRIGKIKITSIIIKI